MAKNLTYENLEGKRVELINVYQLVGPRETFAQLMASGLYAYQYQAYAAAYNVVMLPDGLTEDEQKAAQVQRNELSHRASQILADTDVVLRIQELKKPVIRKLRRKLEYGLQKALEQCEVAYDLAYAAGDHKGILSAVKMQAELAKLLVTQVDINHTHRVLDDASTETLVALLKAFDVRRKQAANVVEINPAVKAIESQTPQGTSSALAEGTPVMAVPITVGHEKIYKP